MKRALIGLLLGCVTMGLGSVATAGDNDQVGIAIHLGALVTKDLCLNAPNVTSSTIVTSGTVGPAFGAWVLVCNGSDSTGIAGVEYGITYNSTALQGVDVFGWNACGSLEFPGAGYPNAGGDNIVTWDPINNCQNVNSEPFVPKTVVAMVGQLYVIAYSPDQLTIVPAVRSGFAKVADCASSEDIVSGQVPTHMGFVEFGGGAGYSPCGQPTPVENTTWGNIKNAFGN